MVLISGLRHLFGRSSISICRRECLALPHIKGLSTSLLLSKLFVGGLSGNTNEQVLKDTFSSYGQVLSASVMINRQTGWSKGYAFVQFASDIDAENAVNQMDGQVLDGKKIIVNFARPGWQDITVDPPKAVGPPSQNLEEFEEQEKVGKKGNKKKGLQKEMSKEKEKSAKQEKRKNEKEGKKKKAPSSSNKQTFIEDLDDQEA